MKPAPAIRSRYGDIGLCVRLPVAWPLAASRGEVTAQLDASATGLPLASLQAPEAHTDASVTGLPVASVQADELDDELISIELDMGLCMRLPVGRPLAASRDEVTSQEDASVTRLPLASVQAPVAQTETSVTGLPVASTQAELLEDDDAPTGLVISCGELLSMLAAMTVPASDNVKTAASADRMSVPCFMMCLCVRVCPQNQM